MFSFCIDVCCVLDGEAGGLSHQLQVKIMFRIRVRVKVRSRVKMICSGLHYTYSIMIYYKALSSIMNYYLLHYSCTY